MKKFQDSVYQLIVETSTRMPADVMSAIAAAQQMEDAGTRSGIALSTIADNIRMADERTSPICQDTGMPTFVIRCPVGASQIHMKQDIHEAIRRATQDGKLRSNSVDSLTGRNSGDNLGPGMPVIHFEQWEQQDIEIRLILKGGGCENKNIQYSLPAELPGLGKAGRDLDGIRKCILHAVYQAQGQGCSAGFIGVGIGGDRTTGYELAKQQLFRENGDVNPVPELRGLEQYIMQHANTLGIGTMGFGGQVTLLGCKIGAANRLPASFFVSVAYNCWAFRRLGAVLDSGTGDIRRWLYRDGGAAVPAPAAGLPAEAGAQAAGGLAAAAGAAELAIAAPSAAAASAAFAATAAASPGKRAGGAPGTPAAEPREVHLTAPLTEAQVRTLRVGDVVVLHGPLYTGRDAIHKHLMDHDAPVHLNGAVIYHCGPVVKQDDAGWHVLAAGPTTSIREEPYQGEIMKKFGIRAVMGKGGMGAKTLQALQEHGGVYLNAIGGAAQYYAEKITRVTGVDLLEFGLPEAMWHLEVEGFAAIVTMDSHGNSLHADIDRSSLEKLAALKDPVF